MDTFRTITASTKSLLTEKRSRFIAYAIPVTTVAEIKAELINLRKEFLMPVIFVGHI